MSQAQQVPEGPAGVGGALDHALTWLHPFAAFEVLFAGPPRP